MSRLLSCVVLVVALSGCETAADGPKSLGPGKHKVVKNMRGYWQAHDAVAGCKWVVNAAKGGVVLEGSYSKGNETQAVILGTGNLGMVFWPNDACGKWTR